MSYSNKILTDLISDLLSCRKEGSYWDFKQDWPDNNGDIIKDIICFSNTVHGKNCFIIFGISDDFQVTGMTKRRVKEADLIDNISRLKFAGGDYPRFTIETIIYDNKELDILIIYNKNNTPFYLEEDYHYKNNKCLHKGIIYTRVEDRNTPDDENAKFFDIENLWKKRFGLLNPRNNSEFTKTAKEDIYDKLLCKCEWEKNNEGFYNAYNPQYTLVQYRDEEDYNLAPEAYSYTQYNKKTSYYELNIKASDTVIDHYQLVVLDSGRLTVPVPSRGCISLDMDYVNCINPLKYYYYLENSHDFIILQFMYDQSNPEEESAFNRLMRIVLLFKDEDERIDFISQVRNSLNLLNEKIESSEEYNNIEVADEYLKNEYKRELKGGSILNGMLIEWRKTKKY